MQCVILCGGLGTRLRSLVSDRPKSLAPVAGQPFLVHLMHHLHTQGVDRFVLATGYLSEQIEALFPQGSFEGCPVEVSREPEPLGTGGALRHALPFLGEDFFVVNGDTWMEADLSLLRTTGLQGGFQAALALRQVQDVQRYGAISLDSNDTIRAFVEKGSLRGEGLINAGVYWLRRSLVAGIPPGKVSLEQKIFPQYLEGGLGGVPSDGRFIDIGIPEDFQRAQELLSHLDSFSSELQVP